MTKGSTERSSTPPQQALVVGDTVYFGLDVLGLDELSEYDRNVVESFVAHAAPKSGIVGALLVDREFRPVTSDNLRRGAPPKLIRPLPVELQRVNGGVETLFKGLSQLRQFDPALQWGESDGLLWVLRSVEPTPLITYLEQRQLAPLRLIDFMLRLIRTLSRCHQAGIVHGHLTTSNIAFSAREELKLLDPLLASAVLIARRRLDPHFIPAKFRTFAPEIVEHGRVSKESDIYGLGTVFEEIQHYAPSGTLPGFVELLEAMTTAEPAERPSLKEVAACLEEARRFYFDSESVPQPVVFQTPSKRVESEPAVRDLPEHRLEGESSESKQTSRTLPTTPVVSFEERFEKPKGAPRLLEKEREGSVHPVRSGGFSPVWAIGAALIFAFWLFSGNGKEEESVQEPQFNQQAIVEAWQSGIPSQMSPVAQAALDPVAGRLARTVILRSALAGDDRNGTVDALFLRVVFDRRWELSLEESDRQIAFTLALGKLLVGHPLKEAPQLESLHPALHLALLVSRARQATQVLSQISAQSLVRLPAPFNLAFGELLRANPDLTLADPAIQSVARFGIRGFISFDEVVTFIEQNPALHLRVVGAIFSTDQSLARKVLTQLLDEPRVKSEEVTWAKAAGLLNWRSLSGGEQLLVFSGTPPVSTLTEEELLLVTRHPSLTLRRYAIEQLQRSTTFEHPAKDGVFVLLRQEPAMLAPDQLFPLMTILKSPGASALNSATIKRWLGTAPPTPILERLILATATLDHYTPVDALVGYYLREIGWKPNGEQVAILNKHPEPNIRFASYLATFDLANKATGLQLLQEALKREDVEDYRTQLEQMVRRLQPPEHS